MTRRTLYIAGGAALLVVVFLAGRYSRPAEVREVVKVETKTVEVTRWQTQVVYRDLVKWRERIVRVEVVRPDGTIERHEEEVRGADIDSAGGQTAIGSTVATADRTEEKTKTTTCSRPDWRVAALAGWTPEKLTMRPDVYGLELDRRLAGTVWLGVWARTDKTAGLSLALEF